MRDTVLVVGGGQSAYQLVTSLRDEGFEGDITWISDEGVAPYQRPPLSKAYLAQQCTAEDLTFQNLDYFERRDIRLMLNKRVVRIDRADQYVQLETGETLAYGELVLAVGARNRQFSVPGSSVHGHYNLRTLDDARTIGAHLTTSKRPVVIGAGFIGLEFAAIACAKGIPVTVIEMAGRVMARAVSEPVATAFQQFHEERGVRFVFNSGVSEILSGTGGLSAVKTLDGREIEADLLLSCIGVIPNTELADACGLAVSNGIVVDQELRTSDPRISALGDCAAFPTRFSADPCRLESIQNAVDQARFIARRLTGKPGAFDAIPWFWSDQGGMRLQIAGLHDGADRVEVRGDIADRKFSAFRFKNNRLVCVESISKPADHMAARKILTGTKCVTPEMLLSTADLRSLIEPSPTAATTA